MQRHCTLDQRNCPTTKKGVLIWGRNINFYGRQNWVKRTYLNHPCLITPTTVRCTDLNLVVTSLYYKFPCGTPGPYMRLAITNDTQSVALHNSTDYQPISADFTNLYNETRFNPNIQLGLIIKQFNLCNNYQ